MLFLKKNADKKMLFLTSLIRTKMLFQKKGDSYKNAISKRTLIKKPLKFDSYKNAIFKKRAIRTKTLFLKKNADKKNA